MGGGASIEEPPILDPEPPSPGTPETPDPPTQEATLADGIVLGTDPEFPVPFVFADSTRGQFYAPTLEESNGAVYLRGVVVGLSSSSAISGNPLFLSIASDESLRPLRLQASSGEYIEIAYDDEASVAIVSIATAQGTFQESVPLPLPSSPNSNAFAQSESLTFVKPKFNFDAAVQQAEDAVDVIDFSGTLLERTGSLLRSLTQSPFIPPLESLVEAVAESVITVVRDSFSLELNSPDLINFVSLDIALRARSSISCTIQGQCDGYMQEALQDASKLIDLYEPAAQYYENPDLVVTAEDALTARDQINQDRLDRIFDRTAGNPTPQQCRALFSDHACALTEDRLEDYPAAAENGVLAEQELAQQDCISVADRAFDPEFVCGTPIAVGLVYFVEPFGTLEGELGGSQAERFELRDPPRHGTVTLTNSVTGEFDYVSDGTLLAGERDDFTFVAINGFSTSKPASVSVEILPTAQCTYQNPSFGFFRATCSSTVEELNINNIVSNEFKKTVLTNSSDDFIYNYDYLLNAKFLDETRELIDFFISTVERSVDIPGDYFVREGQIQRDGEEESLPISSSMYAEIRSTGGQIRSSTTSCLYPNENGPGVFFVRECVSGECTFTDISPSQCPSEQLLVNLGSVAFGNDLPTYADVEDSKVYTFYSDQLSALGDR